MCDDNIFELELINYGNAKLEEIVWVDIRDQFDYWKVMQFRLLKHYSKLNYIPFLSVL